MTFLRARYYQPETGRFVSRDVFPGIIALPQSLNRYSYVQNRPVRYVDSSGNLGQPVSANDVQFAEQMANQMQWVYNVRIERDWRQPCTLRLQPPFHGLWSVDELGIVREVLDKFAVELGSILAVRRAVGGIDVYRRESCPFFCWDVEFQSPFQWPPQWPIKKFNLWCEYPAFAFCDEVCYGNKTFDQQDHREKWGPRIAVAHELGHVWACRSGYDKRLRDEGVGAEGAITHYGLTDGYVEDWAETVAMYMYPQYADILRDEGSELEKESSFADRPGHWDFIQGVVGQWKARYPGYSGCGQGSNSAGVYPWTPGRPADIYVPVVP